jgi:hypothetical protein
MLLVSVINSKIVFDKKKRVCIGIGEFGEGITAKKKKVGQPDFTKIISITFSEEFVLAWARQGS